MPSSPPVALEILRPGTSSGATVPAVEVVGHAGLAGTAAGGVPDEGSLRRAVAFGVDRLEVDVCSTADSELVLRHDANLADARWVGDVELAELRRLDARLLTLDEAIEVVAGHVPLLIDLKTAPAARALGAWARDRRDASSFAACTENVDWLLHLRFAAPRLPRWPSFPDIGERRHNHVQRVAVELLRSHATLGGLRRGAGDIQRALMRLRRRPRESLAGFAGLPWRGRLPSTVVRAQAEVAAEGICVHHWAVSDELVEAAHGLGLHVNSWTVNDATTAARLAGAGVDSVTTDRVDVVAGALAEAGPRRPRGAGALRVGVRSGPR